MPRRHARRRPPPIRLTLTGAGGLIVAVAIALAVLLNRAGFLGTRGDDFARYHNRTFRVERVIDGDTLDLAIPDGRHDTTRVRLWGLDTPETVDPRKDAPDYFGPEAAAFAHRQADGSTVRVELLASEVRDKYGRLLAYVYLPDGSMLNERLLEAGLAYADLRFKHPRFNRFESIEGRARRAGRGLWKEVRPDQWPAWRQRMVGATTAPDASRQ